MHNFVTGQGNVDPALESGVNIVLEFRTGDIPVPFRVEEVEGAFANVRRDVSIVPTSEIRQVGEG